MDRKGVLLRLSDSFRGTRRLNHPVPVAVQDNRSERAELNLVLHHQNGLGSPQCPKNWLRLVASAGRLVHTWKVNAERRAFAELTIYPDGPIALLHNPVHDGQSQTCPFSFLLSGEEGFKETSHYLFRHAGAGIRYPNVDIWPRSDVDVEAGVCLSNFDVFRFDEKSSSVRHCVARIHREVQDHLAQLIGIRADMTEGGFQSDLKAYVLADHPVHHPLQIRDNRIQIHDFLLDDVLAAQYQQLAAEFRRP